MRNKLPQQYDTYFDQIPVGIVKHIIRPDADAVHGHDLQFYDDASALCRIVGTVLGQGLGDGTLAVVIATPDHAASIEAGLSSSGHDVETLKRVGDLVLVDAHETLQRFMWDGRPNPGAFRRAMGEVLARARRGREHSVVRAYTEIVDLLWKEGRGEAAIHVETLWNELSTAYDFELLCGYCIGHFYKGVGQPR